MIRRWSENEVSTRTATCGASATIARVASMPSSTGISRSISTTSGSAARAELDRLRPVGRGTDELQIRLRGDDAREPVAEHAVVVRKQHADHVRGHLELDTRPFALARRDHEVAARLRRQLLDEGQSQMALGAALCTHLGAEAATVVGDDESCERVVDAELDADGGRIRVRDHVAHRLLRHAIDERLLLPAESVGAVHGYVDRHPARPQRADEIADRRLEPRRREVRRMQVDEQRPQIPHGAA